MRQHTRPGQVCYEPFCGSGTQVIVAERLGRRCFGMEISAVYVDVIIRRWQQQTGRGAVLDGSGKTWKERRRRARSESTAHNAGMGRSPPKACGHVGCPNRAPSGKTYCELHASEESSSRAWGRTRTSASARGYGHEWRRVRALVLARDIVCQVCRIRPATICDHIVNKARGGSDDPSNLQGICDGCHKAKTSVESKVFQEVRPVRRRS